MPFVQIGEYIGVAEYQISGICPKCGQHFRAFFARTLAQMHEGTFVMHDGCSRLIWYRLLSVKKLLNIIKSQNRVFLQPHTNWLKSRETQGEKTMATHTRVENEIVQYIISPATVIRFGLQEI